MEEEEEQTQKKIGEECRMEEEEVKGGKRVRAWYRKRKRRKTR